MEIRHIVGIKNPADSLTRQQWKQDQRINEAAKEEESKLFKVLQLPDNPSDKDIQNALDDLFHERQDASIENTTASALTMTTSAQTKDIAQCLVTRAAVEPSSDLRRRMLEILEDESPYKEILEDIDHAPLSA